MFPVSPSAPRGTCCVGSTQSPTLLIVHASQRALGPGHTHVRAHTRQNRPRKHNSREPPGRSFLLKSPQWTVHSHLQVSLKCQERLPTPELHTYPLGGPSWRDAVGTAGPAERPHRGSWTQNAPPHLPPTVWPACPACSPQRAAAAPSSSQHQGHSPEWGKGGETCRLCRPLLGEQSPTQHPQSTP